MGLRDGRKLSKKEAAQIQGGRRSDLAEYEQIFNSLEEGESYKYEIDADQKSITERSRWVAVAARAGFIMTFGTKKDSATGESTITVKKGAAVPEELAQQSGRRTKKAAS